MLEEKLSQLEKEINKLIDEHYITNQSDLVHDLDILHEMIKHKEKYNKEINLILNKTNIENYKNNIDQLKKEIKKLKKEIEKLRNQRQFEQAYQLTLLYPDSPIIQGQKFSICLSMDRMDEVQQIVEKFYDHPRIQSKLCTIYLKQGKYDKVEEIAKRFSTYGPIQSQLCTAYLRQGKYEKVEEIAKIFSTHKPIQSQLCTVYLRQGKYDKVEEIAKIFSTHRPIQSQLRTAHLSQEKYHKVKEISKRFSENFGYIDNNISGIYNDTKARTLTDINMFYFREKIYYEYLDHESMMHIKNLIHQDILHIDPWKKTLMLMAINELRKNKDEMKRLAKDYKRNYGQEREHLKILKKLISEHRVIFDRGLYDDLLGWNKENDLVRKYIKK